MVDSQQQQSIDDAPAVTQIDKDCAYFVRDALFPLRRDWGSSNRTGGGGGGGRHHGQIHPALMALDRLRSTLIDLRPKSISYSNIFPRGVLLVPRSEALDESSAMEYNGQPDVDESKASVEVIPDLLTVRCARCNGKKFIPVSADAYTRVVRKPWQNPDDDAADEEHELVVCSDRILQNDYYRTMGNGMDGQRREDLPMKSMRAVEEILAREITKFVVNPDDNGETANGSKPDEGSSSGRTTRVPPPPPLSKIAFPARNAENAEESCAAFAKLELEAARAAECLLMRQTDKRFTGTVTETFLGSALFPKTAFRVLPSSLQRNFVGRCAYAEAMRNTKEAARFAEAAAGSGGGGSFPRLRPRKCVKQAWADQKKNGAQ